MKGQPHLNRHMIQVVRWLVVYVSSDVAGVASGAVESCVMRVLVCTRAVPAGRSGDGVRLEVGLQRRRQRQSL